MTENDQITKLAQQYLIQRGVEGLFWLNRKKLKKEDPRPTSKQIPLVSARDNRAQAAEKIPRDILRVNRETKNTIPARLSYKQIEVILHSLNDWHALPGYFMISEDPLRNLMHQILELRYQYLYVGSTFGNGLNFDSELELLYKEVMPRSERLAHMKFERKRVDIEFNQSEIRRRLENRVKLYLSMFEEELRKSL